MANVSIKFNGKEFLLSCDDGQEEHLEELLIQINQKFNNLKNELGNLGENKLLLITAVKVMDEYYETKKKVEQKNDEVLAPGGHNFLGKGPLGLKIVHKKAETELSPKTMVSVSEILLKTPYFQFFCFAESSADTRRG